MFHVYVCVYRKHLPQMFLTSLLQSTSPCNATRLRDLLTVSQSSRAHHLHAQGPRGFFPPDASAPHLRNLVLSPSIFGNFLSPFEASQSLPTFPVATLTPGRSRQSFLALVLPDISQTTPDSPFNFLSTSLSTSLQLPSHFPPTSLKFPQVPSRTLVCIELYDPVLGKLCHHLNTHPSWRVV